ncbi:MAG TPA: hypothetical protein VGO52_12035 [Hyphomonadaceae bacterium]|nr:hypothetical protein [Hyphomonadaceae bacterium]
MAGLAAFAKHDGLERGGNMKALTSVVLLAAACQPAEPRRPLEPIPAAPAAAPSTAAEPTFAQTQADKFNSVFGLTPLVSGGPDELRVWSMEYLAGHTRGIIVAPSRITVHEVQDAKPGRPRRVGVLETAQPSPVFRKMDYLASLDGAEWFCPVVDGGALIVDGLHNGRHFSLSATNAWDCEAEKMKSLNEVLGLIGDLPEAR